MAKTLVTDELFLRPRTVEVRSASEPTESYTVTLPYCPCRGFHFRGECSHLLTAMEQFSGGIVAPKRRIDSAS